MKIKNMKRFAFSMSLLILFTVIIIFSIVLIVKSNYKEVETSTTPTVPTIENIETNNQNVIDIGDNNTNNGTSNKEIDFLANVTAPKYFKGEKNIKIPILIYHAFHTPIPNIDTSLYSCEERFDENIKTILDDGYTFITLEDLYKYNKGEIALPEKVMIITMDDGNIGCYTEAFNVLKKYNIPATIFIVNNLVGTESFFTWEQAKEMYDSGLVKIHCHGYYHIAYGSASKEKLVGDYTKSHEEIEEHLGDKLLKIMAYPSGNSSQNSITWLKEAGFEIQIQTKYGTVNKSSSLDLTDLGRVRAEQASGKQILSIVKNIT